jgi:hypothetical protein
MMQSVKFVNNIVQCWVFLISSEPQLYASVGSDRVAEWPTDIARNDFDLIKLINMRWVLYTARIEGTINAYVSFWNWET